MLLFPLCMIGQMKWRIHHWGVPHKEPSNTEKLWSLFRVVVYWNREVNSNSNRHNPWCINICSLPQYNYSTISLLIVSQSGVKWTDRLLCLILACFQRYPALSYMYQCTGVIFCPVFSQLPVAEGFFQDAPALHSAWKRPRKHFKNHDLQLVYMHEQSTNYIS